MPQIGHRSVAFTTPYFHLVAKTVEGAEGDPYYAVETDDYVCIVAITQDRRILLVRQYRPVVESSMLELPAGHVEKGETPEAAARRELLEETGFIAPLWENLGALKPDTGRLGNRMWVFLAQEAVPTPQPHRGEEGLEVVTMEEEQFADVFASDAFDHALHIAAIFLAIRRGVLRSLISERP